MRRNVVHLAAAAGAVLVASLLVAQEARAEVAVGAVAPTFEGREFVNTQPFTFESLRGRFVLLELFHTGSKPCADQVPRLDVLHEKFEDRGLFVVALTNEPRKAVDEFVAKFKPKHAIVIESGDSAKTYGLIKGHPTAFVIGPDGKVVWKGNWADQALMKLEVILPKAKRSPKLPFRFAAQRDAAEAGRYMEARRPLDAEMKAGTITADEKPLVEKMMKWIDQELEKQLYAAAALADEGGSKGDVRKLFDGTIELERLAKECAGHDVGTQAAAGVKNVLSDPARKKELDAWRQLDAAIEGSKGLLPRKAIPLYRAVIAKWKDTAAAKRAAELIAELEKAERGG